MSIAFIDPRPGDKPNPPEIVAKKEASRKVRREVFPKIIDLGIKLAAGTDNLHGMLWLELDWMIKLGLDPMSALQTATRNAADLCQRLDDLGTLEPGKLADIIAVNGNPLKDMTMLQNVVLVMKDGIRYDLSE